MIQALGSQNKPFDDLINVWILHSQFSWLEYQSYLDEIFLKRQTLCNMCRGWSKFNHCDYDIHIWSSSIIFPLDKGTCFSLINQKVLWVHLTNLLLLSIFFIWYKFGNIILQVFNISRNIVQLLIYKNLTMVTW